LKIPCTACIYRKQTEVGHRIFIGCSDEEKKKGFIEDDYWYEHKCSNHTPKEECLICKNYLIPYCKKASSECKFETK